MNNPNIFTDSDQYNDDEDDYISKSAIKRYGKQLRELGKKIVNLPESEFDQIPFDDDLSLKEACLVARKLKPASEELRRQLMHIEALFRKREDEISKYEDALNKIAHLKTANVETYRLEEIRKRLVTGDMTQINELIATNYELDRQKIRSLVSQAKKELANESDTQKRKYRELFQYLKTHIK